MSLEAMKLFLPKGYERILSKEKFKALATKIQGV